jgi:phosphoribosylglycinamide formyltransferase-1
MKRIVVLISGRGSNFEVLEKACRTGQVPGKIVAVISNRADARGLITAQEAGIATACLSHRDYPDREAFDQALAGAIDAQRPDLVVLAGFMRILTPGFVTRYQGRLLNIHPSLLPAYPGLHTHQRALADGVRIHGCTVHFVTAALDLGPIVIQGAVPVLPGDDADALAARVLAVEHQIYPRAVRWFCEDRLALVDSRVTLRGLVSDASRSTPALVSPFEP